MAFEYVLLISTSRASDFEIGSHVSTSGVYIKIWGWDARVFYTLLFF